MRFIATKGTDRIEIEVTDDGVIKLDTDGVSAIEHATVDACFTNIIREAGGNVRRVLKPNYSLHEVLHAHVKDGHSHGSEHTH